jgi:hypothetical protein
MTEKRLALSELLEKAGNGDFAANCGGGGAAIADGCRCGGLDRRRWLRAQRRIHDLAQRLPRPDARHAAIVRLAASGHIWGWTQRI